MAAALAFGAASSWTHHAVAGDEHDEDGDDLQPPALQVAKGAEAAPAPATATCNGEAFAAVAKRARRGVVTVRTDSAWGTGFLIEGGLVVTDFRIVTRPMRLNVSGNDRKAVDATVVAIDESQSVAILRPESPIDGEPLSLGGAAPRIGQEVVVVGPPDDPGMQKKPAKLRRGLITTDEASFEMDPPLGGWEIGRPIVDCDARVVGMVTMKGGLGPTAIAKTRENVAHQEPYEGPVVNFAPIEADFITQGDKHRAFMGLQLGLGITLVDQLELSVYGTVLASVGDDRDTPLDYKQTLRASGGFQIGYRIQLGQAPFSASLVPYVGAEAVYDYTRHTTYETTIDAVSCGAGCKIRAHEKEIESEKWMPGVVFGADLRLDVFTFGYALHVFPTNESDMLMHQIKMGVAF